MFKICTTCKETKLLSEFRKDKNRLDGRQSWCSKCSRSYHKSAYTIRYGEAKRAKSNARMNKLKQWLIEYKSIHGCMTCNEKETCCLDFHHTDPTQKDFTISSSLSRSMTKVQNEINKCVVVCKNCHSKIHAGILVI